MDETPKKQHLKDAPDVLRALVGVVSDSLSIMSIEECREKDRSGHLAKKLLTDKDVEVFSLDYIPDQKHAIQKIVRKATKEDVDLLLLIGGTGCSKNDVTVEAVEPLLKKKLPGFGEIFRYETYQEVGSVAMVTGAFGGIVNNTFVACLPGSPNAVQLGVKLIMKELLHIASLVRR